MIDIRTETSATQYRLDTITDHSHDLYPNILRSILLIKVVSAFELFLIGSVVEAAERDISPFRRPEVVVHYKQDYILHLASSNSLVDEIVAKTARKLSSGGYEEIVKFFRKHYQLSVTAPNVKENEIREIHERRHLYVHAEGRADSSYIARFGGPGLVLDRVVPVGEEYLYRAIHLLTECASHVSKELDRKFPPHPPWRRSVGGKILHGMGERLAYIALTPKDPSFNAAITDATRNIGTKVLFGEVLMWSSTDGKNLRICVSGKPENINSYLKELHLMKSAGSITALSVNIVLEQ